VKTRALKAATKVPAEADAPARESAAAAAGVGDRKTEALRISGGDEGPPSRDSGKNPADGVSPALSPQPGKAPSGLSAVQQQNEPAKPSPPLPPARAAPNILLEEAQQNQKPAESLQELRDRVRNIMQQREKERSHRREQLHADMIRKIAAQEEIRQKKEEAVAAARRKAAEIAEREEQERLLRAARGNRGLSGDPGSGGAPPANASSANGAKSSSSKKVQLDSSTSRAETQRKERDAAEAESRRRRIQRENAVRIAGLDRLLEQVEPVLAHITEEIRDREVFMHVPQQAATADRDHQSSSSKELLGPQRKHKASSSDQGAGDRHATAHHQITQALQGDRHATAHHQIAHALQVAERAFSEEFSLLWDLAAKRVEDEEKLKKILSAAIFVQSRWRGFKTRQGLLLRARAPEDIAARKIQSRWQGRMQRFRSRVRAACVRWDKDSGVTSPAAGSGFGGGGEGQRLAARRLRAPNYRRQLGLVESLFPYDEESVGGPIRTILREMDSELRPKFFERYAQVCEKETLEREIDKLLGDLLQSVSRRRADLLEDKTADAVCASGCSSGQSSAAAHYSRAGEDAASTRAAWEREFELETLTTLRSALLVQRMQHRKEIAKNVAHVADGDGDPQERNTSVLRPTMELLRRKYSELMQAETSALKTVVDETRRKLHAAERAANGEGEHYEKSLARVQGDLARKKEKLRLTSSAFAHEKGVV